MMSLFIGCQPDSSFTARVPTLPPPPPPPPCSGRRHPPSPPLHPAAVTRPSPPLLRPAAVRDDCGYIHHSRLSIEKTVSQQYPQMLLKGCTLFRILTYACGALSVVIHPDPELSVNVFCTKWSVMKTYRDEGNSLTLHCRVGRLVCSYVSMRGENKSFSVRRKLSAPNACALSKVV